MSEQFLNRAQICAAVKEMRGKAVTQTVRSHFDLNAGLLQMLFHNSGDASRCDAHPAVVQKHSSFAFTGKIPVFALFPSIILQRLERNFADRHDSFFGAFTRDPHDLQAKVDVNWNTSSTERKAGSGFSFFGE